jgi:hypothetical protein
MDRPFYEAPEHLACEAEIAHEVGQAWGCRMVKMKRAFASDWAAIRDGEILAMVEIKDRPGYTLDELDSYGGLMVSLQKLANLLTMNAASALPFFVIARDGTRTIYYHRLRPGVHDGLYLGGRRDRGDWQDIEPVALFRSHRFRPLVPRVAPPPGNTA